MLRRTAALAFTVALLAACGGGDDEGADADDTTTTQAVDDETTTTTEATDTTEAAVDADDPLNGFVPEPLEFDGCGRDLECATLSVPLDWDDPEGDTIDLAVTRIPASGGDSQGAIATNPGGPGASGNEFIVGGVFDDSIAEVYDTISWDPRGVGESAPLVCDEAVIEDFVRLDTDPDDAVETAALDEGAQAVGASCEAGSGEELPFVGTASVARDLEAIHRASGEPMGYMGFSYGTSIGLQYLNLFPDGMELGVVLDGVVDPTDTQTDLLRGQAVAFESILDGVLTEAGVAADYDAVAAAVEVAPIPAGTDELRPGDVSTAGIFALYDESLHQPLIDGIADALAGDGSGLLDMANGYRDFGGFGIYQAVSCLDSVNPTGSEAWTAFSDELEAIAPRTGPAVANEMRPCAFWPVPPESIVGPVVAEGSGPVLVIGTTGDPATPIENSESVAATLANGHLIVFDGEGHTAYFTSQCVADAVADYFLDGTVPEDGLTC